MISTCLLLRLTPAARRCSAAPHRLRLYEQPGKMGYLNGAAPAPLRLLDTIMSGYLSALAIAAVFPALRLALDRALLSVLPPCNSTRPRAAVYFRAALAHDEGVAEHHVLLYCCSDCLALILQ